MLLDVSSSRPMRSGKIGLPPKEPNVLRAAVLENFEISLVQIGDEAAMRSVTVTTRCTNPEVMLIGGS